MRYADSLANIGLRHGEATASDQKSLSNCHGWLGNTAAHKIQHPTCGPQPFRYNAVYDPPNTPPPYERSRTDGSRYPDAASGVRPMSEKRPSRRFEAKTVSEIREKLRNDGVPFGTLSAHDALRMLLRSHDELVGALKIAKGYVEKTHGSLAGAVGPENIIKPDLDRINAALAQAGEP